MRQLTEEQREWLNKYAGHKLRKSHFEYTRTIKMLEFVLKKGIEFGKKATK